MTFGYSPPLLLQQQRYQTLQQTLFETEQTARRVATTMAQDPFAAAVVAHYWLFQIRGIGPGDFPDIAHKRAWADAAGTISAALQRGRAEWPRELQEYVSAMDRSKALRQQLGNNPSAHLRATEEAVATTTKRRRDNGLYLKAGIACAVATIPVGVVAELVARNKGQTGACFMTLLLLAGVALVAHSLSGRGSAKRAAEEAALRLAAARADVQALQSFLADPRGGAYLERVWREHPLITEQADIYAGPPSSAVPSVHVYERVVERQVVVTRCRFCSQMTETGTHCTNCGAPI